jgi:phosphonate ABC transporter permease subunit PhnE
LADEQTSSNGKSTKKWRRSLLIVIALLSGFVIYAFAFAKTDVSLEEIQSETRQEQLFKILRALARPDLVHYDKEDLVVTADMYIPCNGSEPDAVTPDTSGATIAVSPTCAEPGDVVTVTGSGFEAGKLVSISFVPKSDFAITLPQGRSEVAEDGTFVHTFEAPKRATDEPQQVTAITQANIGSWRHRVRVWTDTNGNGVRDPANLPDTEDGLATVEIALPELNDAPFVVRSPGGVTLVDTNNNVIDFVGWGGEFEATTGSGTGLTSRDLGVDPFTSSLDDSVQLIGSGNVPGDFAWTGPDTSSFGRINAGQTPGDDVTDLFFNELSFDGDESSIEIAGPPGASLEGVSMIFFDAADGKQYRSVVLADKIDLSPRLSDNALSTWDRIVETVMLALLATTVGTLLAVPLSFLAAKNLMRDIMVPVINLALSLIALPIGLWIGLKAAGWASALAAYTEANPLTLVLAFALVAGAGLLLTRWALPDEEEDERPGLGLRLLRIGALLLVAFLFLIGSNVFAAFIIVFGEFMMDLLPAVSFLGSFVAKLGEITELLIPIVAALVGAGVLVTAANKLGYTIEAKVQRGTVNVLTFILSAAAGAIVGLGIGAVIDWFYQLDNPYATVIIPAVIGGIFGVILAAKALKRESQNIGLTIYYMARTLFNGLRSIEPLVMVIIFVVWVGIGPFAGALALALHTTASLAKLYSEQVESIATGPLEAVRATGATRLQTVVYSVVPQIVPPYISFTMYRWDINVRMSTIIGFAGGGGIGFLLQQNINLLQYRSAAAQMLAIAIVVASMDYLSSRLREHVV